VPVAMAGAAVLFKGKAKSTNIYNTVLYYLAYKQVSRSFVKKNTRV
jgi:hypothetical protein